MFNFLKKAVINASASAQASAEQQAATPYSETKIGRLRYQVEHVFFRDFFFQNGAGLIDALLEPHGMGNVYCTALQEMRAHPKYYDDEFGLESMKTDEGNYMVSCRLPKPEHIGLCYRMHFIFNADFSKSAYYTIERTADGAELCVWDSESSHRVIHAIEQPDWKATDNPVAAMREELTEIVSLFSPTDGLTRNGQAEADPEGVAEAEAEQAVEAEAEAAATEVADPETAPAAAPEDAAEPEAEQAPEQTPGKE